MIAEQGTHRQEGIAAQEDAGELAHAIVAVGLDQAGDRQTQGHQGDAGEKEWRIGINRQRSPLAGETRREIENPTTGQLTDAAQHTNPGKVERHVICLFRRRHHTYIENARRANAPAHVGNALYEADRHRHIEADRRVAGNEDQQQWDDHAQTDAEDHHWLTTITVGDPAPEVTGDQRAGK